jgi:hypothetical protein
MEQSSQVENSSQVVSAPEVQPQAERMVTISESKYNDTIRHSNARVAEKARQEERAIWEAKQSSNNDVQMQNHISPEEIKRIASEAATAQHQEMLNNQMKQQMDAEGARIAQNFFGKLSSADKELYPNLENNIKNADFASIPEIVSFANEMEGTEGIINELLENPLKIPTISYLAKTQPALAKAELKKMAESIKLNQAAANAKMPREPLHRIESSPVGMDNGSMSVSDFRKSFKSKSR